VARVELLSAALEQSYARLRARLDGITDEEFFWQPAPASWTIYQDRPGHWTYHYAIPDPEPAPTTTIGWQLVHLGTGKVMYHEYAYGEGRLTWPQLDIPDGAVSALDLLEKGHLLLRDDLRATDESGLDERRKTNWGESWPAWRIFSAMADHDAFHGGVIGYLRDLHYWTASGVRR